MPKSHKAGVPRTNRVSDLSSIAMWIFFAGCVAEAYLMILHRFYVNGTPRQLVAWDGYLPKLGWIGVCVLAAGAVFAYLRRRHAVSCRIGLALAGLGGYVALVSFLGSWNMTTLTVFSVAVPTAALLGILWCLYDRECALSLTALGLAMVGAWLRFRASYSQFDAAARGMIVLYLVLLTAVVCIIRLEKPLKLPFLKTPFLLLPAKADPFPVFAACALSAVGMVVSLISAVAANYAMWILAVITFGATVYYTAKQM